MQMHIARIPAMVGGKLPIIILVVASLAGAQGCAPGSSPSGDGMNMAMASPMPSPANSQGAHIVAATDSAAGAYVALLGGCNDCHTVGWAESDGTTPDAERLTGSNVGYRGPWGTTYAANLRMHAQEVTEDGWVQMLTTAHHGNGKPPMPWMNTRQMSDQDLRNLYRYVRSLGARGEAAPREVAPGVEPTTPYILMVPQQPASGRP